ncbi:6,7-dimethyl-8-ribityllumazine synthase [Limtongia smithiae]|uniref:6,7-dimethyl-8-ribityllumazine synthase n=1 Tax=Limtongia smithiae TaxID=1125753 RepID=UPI0034CECAB9
MEHTIKGKGVALEISGTDLRIGIVHSRWNKAVIDSLVSAAQAQLLKMGVKPENIVIETVPGSYELPFAVSRLYAASQIQSATTAATTGVGTVDLLTDSPSTETPEAASGAPSTKPLDAIIAIGCLIKGGTMHFEYICESVSTSLMRLQLDLGVPVIFGLLTCLTDEQALDRAGLTATGHNHGTDYGEAAVEMGFKARLWNHGKI